jgi:hypothetical protein
MASRNPKFSIPLPHAEALYLLSKSSGLTPTRCLALVLDRAMANAVEAVASEPRAEAIAGGGQEKRLGRCW